MLTLVELEMTFFLAPKIRYEFDFVFSNFIKKLESNIVINNNKYYIVKNHRNLDINWNSFHRNLIKKNKSAKLKGISTALKVMHHRWNGILKILLAR